MPKLHYIEKLSDNLSIGVQKGSGSTNDSPGVWTARFYWRGKEPAYKSTKVRYEEYGGLSKEKAVKIAYEWAGELGARASRGENFHEKHHVNTLGNSYLVEVEVWTKENELRKANGKSLRYEIQGGRTYWSKAIMYQTTMLWRDYIFPFMAARLKDSKKKEHPFPAIRSVTKRDWDQIDNYIQDEHSELGIEYRLKIITEVRRFLQYCFYKELIDDVPSIARPSRGGKRGARERRRREITPDDYTAIMKYQRAKYNNMETPLYRRQWSYLFHLWTLILANTGIRPPTSGTEHTMMKWEHVKLGKKPILKRPDEKGHTYEALIMQNAVAYFEALKKFYSEQGMSTTNGYVFAHWTDQGETIKDSLISRENLRWRVGEPIKSFRKQWTDMVYALDLAEKGNKQSDNVSPSSLRSWFITQRLYYGKDLRIEELAEVTGTSVDQITERYFRLDMSRSYDHLSAGGYDRGDKEITLNKDGFYNGFK